MILPERCVIETIKQYNLLSSSRIFLRHIPFKNLNRKIQRKEKTKQKNNVIVIPNTQQLLCVSSRLVRLIEPFRVHLRFLVITW